MTLSLALTQNRVIHSHSTEECVSFKLVLTLVKTENTNKNTHKCTQTIDILISGEDALSDRFLNFQVIQTSRYL